MIKRVVSLLLLAGLLTACGNKGPLVLPDKPQADAPTTPAQPAAADQPATEP